MLKRSGLLSLLVVAGLCGVTLPVQAQALLPYALPLDHEALEEEGLALAQEAAQLAQFQQFGPALRRAQLAAQLAPNNAQVQGLLGSLYLQDQNYELAIAALERARRLEPTNPTVLFALGTARFGTKDYAQAVSLLESGLRFDPDNAGALFDLGNALYMMGRYEAAIAAYEQSMAVDSEFWPSINNIGLVLYEMGRPAEAIAKWEATLEISEQPEPKLAIAVALYAKGDRSRAIALGTTALESDSRYSELDFLIENLWGEELMADTRQFFAAPDMQSLLAQL